MDTSGSETRRTRDPAAARARILDAAAAEFAARGFAGARVDRVARGAGLNKRMLYHYFGDKRGLHRVVMDQYWPAATTDAPTASALSMRLLLWALLEPETAGDARRRLPPGLQQSGAAVASPDPLTALALSLVGESAPAGAGSVAKPRIRLKTARRP